VSNVTLVERRETVQLPLRVGEGDTVFQNCTGKACSFHLDELIGQHIASRPQVAFET
jgi:hypothetical protein